MLLDPHPKVRREDLYDMDGELNELLASLNERLVAIVAPRRMGKTSVLNVFLQLAGQPHVKLDGRELHVKGVTTHNLLAAIGEGLRRLLPLHKRLLDFIKVEGVIVRGLSVHFDHRKLSPLDILKRFNDYAEGTGKRFLVAIDEAQYLRFGRRLDALLAYCVDNLASLTFVLTGSEVGLLHDFLGTDNPRSPLYGRRVKVVTLRRFTRDESLDFLRRGLEELNAPYDAHVLEEAVDLLDGIPGWLTLFGYSYARDGASLESFVSSAAAMVREELRELFARSGRYKLILKAIASGFRRWSDIYRFVQLDVGPIARSDFNYLLTNLVKMALVEKANGEYVIPDPIVRRAVRELD